MKLLLDTCAYSEFKRGGENVAYLVRRAERIHLSAIVAGELLYGFRQGKRLRENLRELDSFLDNPWVRFLPVTRDTADRFSRIMTNLRKKGKPIPTNDVWIAAQAMETGAELVTLDDHFEHIDGLVWVHM
jgi:tRNA(fMet)-specific endonuclease VapC